MPIFRAASIASLSFGPQIAGLNSRYSAGDQAAEQLAKESSQ